MLWQTTLNNTSSHKQNNYQPNSVPKLKRFLRTIKDRFSSIVTANGLAQKTFSGASEVYSTGAKRNKKYNFEDEKKNAARKLLRAASRNRIREKDPEDSLTQPKQIKRATQKKNSKKM